MIKIYLNQLIFKILSRLLPLIFLSACAQVSPSPSLKIGMVAPFEGLHRPLGYEALFGVKLALQERNLAQGVNGYRVELVALNDFDDPTEAQIQARALVADPDVLGIVGHLSSATTLVSIPIYQEANLAVSIPWTTATSDLQFNQGGWVSLAANATETSTRLDSVVRAMGFDEILILADRNIGPDDDIGPISNDIQALQLATEGVRAGETILALERAGVSLPLLGQVDVGSPQLLQVAKAVANGLIFVSPGPNPQDIPGSASFIEAYQALAGFPPGPRAVLAYDATHVLLDSIEQAIFIYNNQPTRSQVSSIITQIRRRGLSGEIAFDAQGQRMNAPVWVYQISDEEYPGVLIAP